MTAPRPHARIDPVAVRRRRSLGSLREGESAYTYCSALRLTDDGGFFLHLGYPAYWTSGLPMRMIEVRAARDGWEVDVIGAEGYGFRPSSWRRLIARHCGWESPMPARVVLVACGSQVIAGERLGSAAELAEGEG